MTAETAGRGEGLRGCAGPMSWGNGHGRLDRWYVNCACGLTVENLSSAEAMDDVVAWHKGKSVGPQPGGRDDC